jgi:hypothetical protein
VAIAALGAAAFDLGTLPTLLLAGAGAGSVAVGVATGSRPPWERRARRELLLTGSVPTLVLTFGVTVALVGAATTAPAFLWPGLLLLALGAGGIVREWRAERRVLADVAAHARHPTDAGPPPERTRV